MLSAHTRSPDAPEALSSRRRHATSVDEEVERTPDHARDYIQSATVKKWTLASSAEHELARRCASCRLASSHAVARSRCCWLALACSHLPPSPGRGASSRRGGAACVPVCSLACSCVGCLGCSLLPFHRHWAESHSCHSATPLAHVPHAPPAPGPAGAARPWCVDRVVRGRRAIAAMCAGLAVKLYGCKAV